MDDDHSARDADIESLLEKAGFNTKLNWAEIREFLSTNAETRDARTFRRLRGDANKTLQGDGFVLDGVWAHSWFASLGLSKDTPGELQEQVAKLVVEALEPTAEWAGATMEQISVPPHNAMLLWGTCIYLRLRGITSLRVAVIAALVADLITSNPPVAVGASLVAALWDNVSRLTDDEIEIFRCLQDSSNGSVYTEWVPEETLLKSLPTEEGEDHYRALLASMQSKGILEEGSRMWRAVR